MIALSVFGISLTCLSGIGPGTALMVLLGCSVLAGRAVYEEHLSIKRASITSIGVLLFNVAGAIALTYGLNDCMEAKMIGWMQDQNVSCTQ